MTDDTGSEVARLLRQRVEMGTAALYFDGLTRAEALALAAAGREGAPQASSAAMRRAATRLDAEGGGWPSAGPEPATRGPSTQRPPGAAPFADPAPSADPVQLPDSYPGLRDVALGCTRCRLAGGRTQVVFSDGAEDARLMVVGEAPGANEDETGLPFVGAAGKFLDLLLATVGLSRRESVYICNVIKCRPPGNRDPLPDEIEACSPYLKKQIDLIAPEVLLAVGSFAGQLLTGGQKAPLGRLRGKVHSYQGVPLVVTYHPAALLRNAGWTRSFWDDLQLLRRVMDGTG